jgi:uncharacterized protein
MATACYLDSSLITAGFVPDEVASERALDWLSGRTVIVTGSLSLIEVPGALRRATIADRLADLEGSLRQLDAMTSRGGPLLVLDSGSEGVADRARDLCLRFGLRALDALHIAVADVVWPRVGAGDLIFATADRRQAAAARAAGLTVDEIEERP